jgi:nicotinamide-nucleotide amidase
MNVELVIIGSELLLGEILDTNARAIALALRAEGLALERVTTVGDNRDAIAEAIRAAVLRSDAVLTTGGLGPTVDDPTRASAAQAAGVALEFHPELWEAITARFARSHRVVTDNNRVQAYLPAGAEAMPNPVGTAPGFALPIGKTFVLAMPGVPTEMELMLREQVLPRLRARFGPQPVLRTRVLHVVGLTESQVDSQVGEFEKLENPAVGLAAHPGRTDIRITARGRDETEALAVIAAVELEMRCRLGSHIFGADSDTFAAAVLRKLAPGGSLVTAEWGTGGALASALSAAGESSFRMGMVLPAEDGDPAILEDRLSAWQAETEATHALGISFAPVPAGFGVEFILKTGMETQHEERLFQVPLEAAREWAAAIALTILWNRLP